MEEDERYSVREDLGYGKQKQPVENPYRYFKSAKMFEREPDEVTDRRKRVNLEHIEALKKVAESCREEEGRIQLKIRGYLFDLYPTSDCWFSYSKEKYGTGIESLKNHIERKLIET